MACSPHGRVRACERWPYFTTAICIAKRCKIGEFYLKPLRLISNYQGYLGWGVFSRQPTGGKTHILQGNDSHYSICLKGHSEFV